MCVCVSDQTVNKRRPLKLRQPAETNFDLEFIPAIKKNPIETTTTNYYFLISCGFIQIHLSAIEAD